MNVVRFNPVFFGLMSVAAVSAFLIPSRYTDRFTPQVQMLFWPVSRPAGAVAQSLAGRPGVNLPPANKDKLALWEENQQLVGENIKLKHDLEELASINDERSRLGDLRPLCTPVKVLGEDSGTRQSLAIAGSTLQGFTDGMCVLSTAREDVQIVGKLQRSGVLGGQVQLITNPGFRTQAYFAGIRRITPDPSNPNSKPIDAYVRLNKEQVLVEGVGKQTMLVRVMKKADREAWTLQAGDFVVLDDPDWPSRLRGKRIGRISEIVPHKEKALFEEVRITPLSDLLTLREVMIFKDK